MTRVQRGRGGWVSSGTGGFAKIAALGLICVTLALSACAAKKKPGAGEAGGRELGEQGLGAKGGSLEQFKKGTYGQEGAGPLSDIHFDLDEFTVRPQDSEILRTNADWLKSHQGTRVQVEGHCDERGSEQYNIALGAKRAQAAKDYLTTLGISGDRVSTISYGKELPLCTEHEESCWEQNRRDHFVVMQ